MRTISACDPHLTSDIHAQLTSMLSFCRSKVW
jgi:hypothetical protein